MTYQECVDYILSIPLFAPKLGTDNLLKILDVMGHPENSYQIIHVAGTNGKGSTCSFLASILECAGYKVGLFTSPHLVKINERISVNRRVICDDDFLCLFEETMQYVNLAKKQGVAHPSFFEFVFLMGVLYFKNQNVDYAILETGMGGRLDATNVVTPVLCVITSVGLDHEKFLGDTIEKIAKEKAGIMKPGVPVVFFDRKDEATPVMEQNAEKTGAFLHCVEKKQGNLLKITKKTIDFSFDSGYHKYDMLSIKKTALYQIENAMLAVRAYELLILMTQYGEAKPVVENRLSAPITKKDIDFIRQGLIQMVWSCRMEEVAHHIYVDGAHNEEAIEAFCKNLEIMFPMEHKILLFAVSKDKNYKAMIERLCKITFDEIIIVRYEGSRSAEVDTVKDTFRLFSSSKITAFDDIRTGFVYGKSHVDNQYLFCVGSLYLAGDLLKLEYRYD